jgi:hypothetical protein
VLDVMGWECLGPVLPLQGGMNCYWCVPLPGPPACPIHAGLTARLEREPVITGVCSAPIGLPCKGKM